MKSSLQWRSLTLWGHAPTWPWDEAALKSVCLSGQRGPHSGLTLRGSLVGLEVCQEWLTVTVGRRVHVKDGERACLPPLYPGSSQQQLWSQRLESSVTIHTLRMLLRQPFSFQLPPALDSFCPGLWGQPPPHPSDLKPSGIYVLISLPGITFSVALCVLSNEPLFLKCIWKEHVSIPVFNLPFKSRNWVHSTWIHPPPPHCCTISMVSKVCFKNEDNRRWPVSSFIKAYIVWHACCI